MKIIDSGIYNMIVVAKKSGEILYASNCEETLGYSKTDMIGNYLKDYIHEADKFLVESRFFSESTSSSSPYVFRIKAKGNSYNWFEATVEFLRNLQQPNDINEVLFRMRLFVPELSLVVANTNEIIEEYDKIDSINGPFFDNEEILQQAPISGLITKEGEIKFANSAVVNLLGFQSKEQMVGINLFHFIDQEYHNVVRKSIELLQTGAAIGVSEQQWIRSDGKKLDVEVKAIPILHRGKTYEFFVLHDITSRKNFEEILQKSRERYQRIIQNSIDAIAVIYQDKWVFINDSGVKMFGADSYTEMLGKDVYSFLHPDNDKETRAIFDEITSEKKEVQFSKQSWYTFQSKQFFTELVSIPTLYFGEPAVQVIIRDISDRKHAEKLMLKSEKLTIAGQLAAGIAHEIRNPLTSIKGFLQLIKLESQAKKQYFDIIFSELNRVELILSELLVLAKPNTITYKKADIKSILTDVVTLLNTQAILQNIQIELYLEEQESCIYCDENQIKQVFINLIKNSIDAMPSGGMIKITSSIEQDKIVILFKDQGCGIPEDVLNRIGEPFYTTKEKGTGLGLMVSYNIIEDHQGSISVFSKKNEGTTFEIVLPLQ